jgi:hypothetical protein
MAFQHPAFLWALTALAIPVLIHLFQLRRFKRIDFTHVRLLAEVSQQTRARRKVQHWLVLMARCLAISALVLAFARPYLRADAANAQSADRAVSIYIDDSYSMDGVNAQGRLLDQARKAAQDIVMAHSATDRFQVVSGALLSRQQALLTRDEGLQAAAEATASPYSTPLSKAMARQREALATSNAAVKRAYVLSDLQRGIADLEAWRDDSLTRTVIIPFTPAASANLSIDSAWFANPVRRMGVMEDLHVRLFNHGDAPAGHVPARLAIDGVERAIASLSVPPGVAVDTVLRFRNDAIGLHRAELSIADHPVTFDDRLYLAYRTIAHVRVLLIHADDAAGDRAIESVFATDSAHAFTRMDHRAIDLARLAEQDLVITNALPEVPGGLARSLEDFARAGGSIAVIPPSDGDPGRYAALFAAIGAAPPERLDTARARVERIDLEQPFYRDVFATMPRNVDLPFARERWSLKPPPGSDALLRAQDGLPFLARTRIGRGSAYLFASPLDERAGNLTRHALFATTLLRMAELARPSHATYALIGGESLLAVEGIELQGEKPPTLRGPGGIELIPEVRRLGAATMLALHDELLPPGHYWLARDGDTLAGFAMNLSRAESDLRCMDAQALREALAQHGLKTFDVMESTGDLSLRLAGFGKASSLWKWLIAFALLMLIAETLLLSAKR